VLPQKLMVNKGQKTRPTGALWMRKEGAILNLRQPGNPIGCHRYPRRRPTALRLQLSLDLLFRSCNAIQLSRSIITHFVPKVKFFLPV
jgi:hypothetical protein